MKAAWITNLMAAVVTVASVWTVKGESTTLSSEEKIGNGKYMTTTVNLDSSGNIKATTVLKNHNNVFGFTGGVFLVFMDENKNPVHTTEMRKYGINASFFKKKVTRTVNWSDTVPAEVLPQITSVSIIQDHEPTYRVIKWVWSNRDKIIAHMTYVRQLYEDLKNGDFELEDGIELVENHLNRL